MAEELPVTLEDAIAECGTVSLRKEVASIGLKFTRQSLALGIADRLFAGGCLDVRLELVDDQQRIFKEDPVRVQGVVDVHRYGTDADSFRATFGFSRDSVDIPAMGALAQKTVKVTIRRIKDAEKKATGNDAELDPADVPEGDGAEANDPLGPDLFGGEGDEPTVAVSFRDDDLIGLMKFTGPVLRAFCDQQGIEYPSPGNGQRKQTKKQLAELILASKKAAV